MSADTYHPLYLKGIGYFNECEFFEAHEAWEELWVDTQGDDRPFYQGLIQAAVALHHFGNGNIRGARKLNRSCRGYLDPSRPTRYGLDLDKFLVELDDCFRDVVESEEEFPEIEIVPDRIPEIHLDPPPQL